MKRTGLPLPNCVTLDKSYKLSKLEISHLSHGDNTSASLVGSFWILNEIPCVKSLVQSLYLPLQISGSIIITLIFE